MSLMAMHEEEGDWTPHICNGARAPRFRILLSDCPIGKSESSVFDIPKPLEGAQQIACWPEQEPSNNNEQNAAGQLMMMDMQWCDNSKHHLPSRRSIGDNEEEQEQKRIKLTNYLIKSTVLPLAFSSLFITTSKQTRDLPTNVNKTVAKQRILAMTKEGKKAKNDNKTFRTIVIQFFFINSPN